MVVKITDVARHAGVAPSTVSYVLTGRRSISVETRRRVEAAIAELGYRPHAGARALASNRSNVLALMIPLRPGMYVPIVMQFAVSVVTAARKHDHDVLLLTQDEGEEGLRRVAGTAMVDALVVMDVEVNDARLPLLRSLARPTVLIGFPGDASGLTCVDLDFEAAGALAVEHLAGLGHSQVALVGSPPEVYARQTGFARRTEQGFLAAARRLDVRASVHPCEANAPAARELAATLLAAQPDLTGVVVHNEPIQDALVEAFGQAGRDVPGDLSVVAICPDDLAERAALPLTSVPIPAEEIGAQAVGLLMSILDDRLVAPATLVPPRIVTRASCAPRRGQPRRS
jgi:DNA-binding LacI/PurR family transcriptional regulator